MHRKQWCISVAQDDLNSFVKSFIEYEILATQVFDP